MNAKHLISGIVLLLLLGGLLFLLPSHSTLPAAASSRDSAGNGSSFNDNPSSNEEQAGQVIVSDPVIPVVVGPVRDLPPYQVEPREVREINPRQNPSGQGNEDYHFPGGPDPLLALQEAAPAPSDRDFDTPIFNFEGAGFQFLNPPDTNGAVGKDHYIQMVNATVVSIYNKNTGALIQQFDLTTLGGCSTGNGDPIVLYDHLADRWLLSEFGAGNSMCAFISQTDDPTGSYFSYQFPTPNFPDYPKYGVWPDGYYVSTNEGGSGPAAYALDRVNMLAGSPATSQRFTGSNLPGFGFEALTPSDWDGATPPPAGAPNYFMRHRDTEAHGPVGFPTDDFLQIWAFHVDWVTPANSTFTQLPDVLVAEFDSDICGLTAFSGIAMPGVAKCAASSLDPLREVIMFKLQYRNFGSHETLVGNLVTDVTGADDAGVRWFELRKVGVGDWGLHQEGTYAPDGDSRWMGAIAMDGAGNIAMGYNVSSGSTFPSLRYVGRLSSDPLGTMPQGEYNIIAGTAANGSNRYGDYSGISVDPIDDCIFWFTGEYNPASQWSTRIAAFRFDACGSANFTMSTSPVSLDICSPANANYTVDTNVVSGFSGDVSLAAVGNPGSAVFTPNPVTPPGSSSLDISGAAAGNYSFDVVGTSVLTPALVHTNTVALNVYGSSPAAPTLVSPPDGATDVDIAAPLSWNAVADATSYTVEVATDIAFSNIVYSNTLLATSDTATGLGPLTTYYWRVTAMNVCGSGAASSVFSFTTKEVPPILLVDDDDNTPDVQSLYTAALDALGAEYDIWNTNNSDNEPNFGFMSAYDAIVWFTGHEFGGFAGPSAASEAELGDWLDAGGCFFITSQDYRFDRGVTPFMTNYLGLGTSSNDNGAYTSVIGQGSVFGGLGPYPLSYPYTDFADILSPNGTAELAFDGNNGNDAAVNKDSGVYKTTFFGYPWDVISSASGREEVMETVLNWCGALGPSGTLAGTVIDDSDSQPINGALITADDGNEAQSTTTNSSGNYEMTLPPGTYDVLVTASGYFSETVNNVTIITDTVTTLDFALTPQVGTLERDQDLIEDTVTMGESVTHTLTVSNTGTVPFDFTAAAGESWADVSPNGGTLNPGEAMVLSVIFDSNATAGPGTYSTTLTFSGDFDNSPDPVDLVLHVLQGQFDVYMPAIHCDGCTGAATPTASLPWFVPLIGLPAVVKFGFWPVWLRIKGKGNL